MLYWDTSNVTDMSQLFSTIEHYVSEPFFIENINYFYDEIVNWDTSKVGTMKDMFQMCSYFNSSSIIKWDVSNVKDMSGMFDGCAKFNQPLQHWQVHNVADMSKLFSACSSFNQPISTWEVSSVVDMSEMFNGALLFNQLLQPNNWSIWSSITWVLSISSDQGNMSSTRHGWDVSNVKNMSKMFVSAKQFNQPLDQWNTCSVVDMKCKYDINV